MKSFILITLIASAFAVDLDKSKIVKEGWIKHATPSLDVPKCGKSKPATVDSFKLPSGVAPFPAATHVEICWTEQDLDIKFYAKEDKFLKNDIKGENAPIHHQEVIEVFVGDQPNPNRDFIQSYLEFNVSPKDQIFAKRIINPYGNMTDYSHYSVSKKYEIKHTTLTGNQSY